MNFKLRKSDLSGRIHVSPTYLTNGRWMVRKDLLDKPALYASKDTIEAAGPNDCWVDEWEDDSTCERVIPKDKNRTHVITRTNDIHAPDVLDHKRDMVKFQSEDNDKRVTQWFNRRYVQMFALGELHGAPDKAWATEDNGVVIMPMPK